MLSNYFYFVCHKSSPVVTIYNRLTFYPPRIIVLLYIDKLPEPACILVSVSEPKNKESSNTNLIMKHGKRVKGYFAIQANKEKTTLYPLGSQLKNYNRRPEVFSATGRIFGSRLSIMGF